MKTKNSGKTSESKSAKAISDKVNKPKGKMADDVKHTETGLAATLDARKGHVVGSSGNGIA